MTRTPLYAFDITLHVRPADARMSGSHADAWGTWPTLAVPREALAVPFRIGFDAALERLAALDRMFAEPDGSFVWTSPREGLAWQVDGNAFDRDDRLLLCDLRGSCPPEAFDRLLAAFGWPAEPVMMQLVRPAVFLDEQTFRQHALQRGGEGDGDGKALRPR